MKSSTINEELDYQRGARLSTRSSNINKEIDYQGGLGHLRGTRLFIRACCTANTVSHALPCLLYIFRMLGVGLERIKAVKFTMYPTRLLHNICTYSLVCNDNFLARLTTTR